MLFPPGQAAKLKRNHDAKLADEFDARHGRWGEIVYQLAREPERKRQQNSISGKDANPVRTKSSHNNPCIRQQIGPRGILPVEAEFSRNAVLYVEFLQASSISKQRVHLAETQRCEVSNAGFAPQNVALFRGVLLDVSRNFRPRTDKAHVASQNVPKLRQLVQFRAPQDSADSRNARVAFSC